MCKTIAGGKLFYRELSLVLCDDPQGYDARVQGGKLKREGIYVYSLLVYSVYIAKTNTTL